MRLIAYSALDLSFCTDGFDGDVLAAVCEV